MKYDFEPGPEDYMKDVVDLSQSRSNDFDFEPRSEEYLGNALDYGRPFKDHMAEPSRFEQALGQVMGTADLDGMTAQMISGMFGKPVDRSQVAAFRNKEVPLTKAQLSDSSLMRPTGDPVTDHINDLYSRGKDESKIDVGKLAVEMLKAYPQGLVGTAASAIRGYALAEDEMYKEVTGLTRPTTESELYQLGNKVQEIAEKHFPGDPEYQENFIVQVMGAMGSLSAFVLASIVGRGAASRAAVRSGAGPEAAKRLLQIGQYGTALPLAATAGIDEAYYNILDFNQQHPDLALSEKQALELAMKGAFPGMIQVATLGPLLRRVPIGMRGSATTYLLRRMAEAGVTEFTVETAGAILQDALRSTYDADHPVMQNITKQIRERGLVAGTAAMMLQALMFRGQGAAVQSRITELQRKIKVGQELTGDDTAFAEEVGFNVEAAKQEAVEAAEKAAAEEVVEAPPAVDETVVEKPADMKKDPSHIFISKKGNRYYRVDGKWFNEKGKVIENRFVINAAEKGKQVFRKDLEDAGVEKSQTYVQELRALYNELDAANVPDSDFARIYRSSGEKISDLPKKGETWKQRADRVISKLERGEDEKIEAKKVDEVVEETDHLIDERTGIEETAPPHAETTSRKEVEFTKVRQELTDVFNLVDPILNRKKKFNVFEHNLAEGEEAKVHAIWHDAAFRFIVTKDPSGNLSEGPSGSYDTVMMGSHAAASASGIIPAGYTMYVIDIGPGNVRSIDIYRSGEVADFDRSNALEDPSIIDIEPIEVTKPNSPEAELSSLRDTPEETQQLKKLYADRTNQLHKDPDMYLGKMINDVNRYLDGEDVAIDKVITHLDELNKRANEVSHYFESPEYFRDWKSVLEDALKWAKKAGGDKGGTRLDFMIPIDQVPEQVSKVLKGIKATVGALYRNKEVWQKTGFWLGKDGKWRYELKIEDIKYDRYLLEEMQNHIVDLDYIIGNKEVFNAVPEARDLKIKYGPSSKSSFYMHQNRLIVVAELGNEHLFHELQHAINRMVGSKFTGTNVKAQRASFDRRLLEGLRASAKTDEVRTMVEGIIKDEYIEYRGSDSLAARNLINKVLENDSIDRDVKDIARGFSGFSAYTEYLKDPGEMEARLASERMEMSPKERDRVPPWDTLDKILEDEGLAKMGGDPGPGTTLYTGIDIYSPVKRLLDWMKDEGDKKPLKAPLAKPKDPFVTPREAAREELFKRRGRLAIANYETNKFVNEIERELPRTVDREAIPFLLEKTDVPKRLNRPDIEKAIKDKKDKLNPVADRVRAHFLDGWHKMKYWLPDMDVNQVVDYVTHLWHVPRNRRVEVANWFSTKSRFWQERMVETIEEGVEKFGLVPKTLDIVEIIKLHDSAANRAIENSKYLAAIKQMTHEGMPLMRAKGDSKVPHSWVEYNHPMVARKVYIPTETKGVGVLVDKSVMVHPDLVRPLDTLFQSRFDHPIINAYEAINGILKKSWLTVSLFHHFALGEVGVATMGPVKTLNAYINVPKIWRALANNDLDVYSAEWGPIAKDGLNHNLQIGASADVPVARIQKYLNNMAFHTRNIPLLSSLTAALKGANKKWDEMLWTYLHDHLKLYAYEHMVSKVDMNKDITKQKREITQFINDTFGGQNWDSLLVTPRELQLMTMSLLSADWTVSTIRQALAPTGIGKVYGETAHLRRGMGRGFWLRAALYFGVGMNLLNAAFRAYDRDKHPEYYPDDEYSLIDLTMFGNTIGQKTYLFAGRYDDGSERYIRWGKQFRELFELATGHFQKLGSKGAPAAQLASEIFTSHSLSGFKNDDLAGTKGLERAVGILKTVAKAPIPLSLKKVLREDIEWKPTDFFMPSTKGITRYRVMEYFKEAIETGDEELLEQAYVAAIRNGLPAFILFNSALGWAESDAIANIKETVSEIEELEVAFYEAETPQDKRRIGGMIARLKREEADFNMGLKLLEAAKAKASTYEEPRIRKSPRLPFKRSGEGSRETPQQEQSESIWY